LNRRYGQASSLDDYERKAQAMTYDGERAMFEAYARNKYTSTGVIQWMLNNAWPSLIWHLYDYYLAPAGGYSDEKSCEPIHVQYSYDETPSRDQRNLRSAQGHEGKRENLQHRCERKSFPRSHRRFGADSSTKAFDLPKPEGLTPTYFLKLDLRDAAGKLVSENFYWLSTKRTSSTGPKEPTPSTHRRKNSATSPG